MAKFVYLYTGAQMAETPEAQEQAMQAWGAWFGTLGAAVTETGNPFGSSATVKSGGTVAGGTSNVGGYSIIEADSLDEASAKVSGCPVLQSGGSVEVYEALAM
ncbi:YciI family protein [Jatrophihabitans sp. DSM 45814]